MKKSLAIHGDKVVLLSKQLRSGTLNFSNIPHLVKQLLTEEMWREFKHPSASQLIDNSHLSFAEFVVAQPPIGLGGDLKSLENILLFQTRASIENDAQTAREAIELFTYAITGKTGNPNFDDLPDSIVDKVNNNEQASGNKDTYALRKLRKERPDLHRLVVAGGVSANGAMIEAGFRKRRFSIPQDDIGGAAKAIKNKLSTSQLKVLIEELQSQQ